MGGGNNMPHGRIEKAKILNDEDATKKIKREFWLSKKMYNSIADDCMEEETTFSAWVNDACRRKLKAQNRQDIQD